MSELHIDANGNISNLYEMDIENKPERAANEVHTAPQAPATPKPIRQGFNLAQLRAMSSNANKSVSVPLQNPTATSTEEKPEPAVEAKVEPVKEPEHAPEVKVEPVKEPESVPVVVEESTDSEEIKEAPVEPVIEESAVEPVVEEPVVEPMQDSVAEQEVEPIQEMNLTSEPVAEPVVVPVAQSTTKVLTVVSNEEIAKLVNSSTQSIWAWVTRVVTKKPSWVSYGATIMESKEIPGLRLYNCHKSGKNSFVVTIGAGDKFSGVTVEDNKPSGDSSAMLSSDGYYINYGSIVSATACMTEFPTYGI